MKITIIEVVLLGVIFSIVGAAFPFLVILAMTAVLLALPLGTLYFLYLCIKEKLHARSQRNSLGQP